MHITNLAEFVNLPSISIVIPTFNEEENIEKCLSMIFIQKYPKELLQVIIVDAGSTDRTIEIANKFDIEILDNSIRKDAETAKMMGFKNSKGDLFLYLDADIQLTSKDWLNKMITPLLEDPEVVGVFTRFLPRKTDPPINRFISYNELQCDPLYEFLTPKIKETIVKDKSHYKLCKFIKGYIPPVGLNIYRKTILDSVLKANETKLMDVDLLVSLSENGYDKFAYVVDAGMYHLTVKTLRELIQKRLRNIDDGQGNGYLPNLEHKKYLWLNFRDTRDIIRMAYWIFYAHAIIPAALKGIYKSILYRDLSCLYEPIVSLVITDTVIYGFLRNPKGRNLFKQALKVFFLKC